jgi:hypothetical protein
MSRWMCVRALAVAILAALAIGVAVSSASLSDREIQKGNTSCSTPNGYRSLGVAFFSFDNHSDSLQVIVNIKHGLPKTAYTVTLIDADTCTGIVTFAKTITTKKNGKGRREYRTDVGASRAFVVDVFDGSQHAYSESVHYS